jgi:excinuclease UvrABC ATPase subunit
VSSLTVQQAQFFAALDLTEKKRRSRTRFSKRFGEYFFTSVAWASITSRSIACHRRSLAEAQWINLATSLGSALVSTLYVLDGPSIGLHSRDNRRSTSFVSSAIRAIPCSSSGSDMIRVIRSTSSIWGLAPVSRAAAWYFQDA